MRSDPDDVVVHKMTLLPPAPDVCQACARDHDPAFPHDQQSLYWQTRFELAEGRPPTWADAMAHCDLEMQRLWCEGLENLGVDPGLAPLTVGAFDGVDAELVAARLTELLGAVGFEFELADSDRRLASSTAPPVIFHAARRRAFDELAVRYRLVPVAEWERAMEERHG